MKLTITLVSLVVVCTAPVLAGEVVVQSGKAAASHKLIADRAFNACAQAFVERILPGQDVNLHGKLDQTRLERKAVVWRDLSFTLKAFQKSDHSKLAEGVCTANRDAQVIGISIRTAPAVKLAGLTPNDVQLAVVSR